jgi:AraC-like DNA-binding protein
MSKIKLVFTRDTLAQLIAMKAADSCLSKRDCGGVLGVNLITLNRAADRAGLRDELTEIFPVSVFKGFESTKPTAELIKRKADKAVRDEIEVRYARSLRHAAMVRQMSNSKIGADFGLSHSSVQRIIDRRFRFVMCNRPKDEISVPTLLALKSKIKARDDFQRLADLDSVEAIAKDTGYSELQVLSIGSRALSRSEQLANNVRCFFTRSAVNPGQCVGYY